MAKDRAEEQSRIIDKVVRLAKSRGLTQSVLEDRLNLPHGRITKWISGQGEPSASQIWEIAQFLTVDVTYFLDPTVDSPAVPGRNEYELAEKLMRHLGPEEAMRRLSLSAGRPDSRPEDASPRTLSGVGPRPPLSADSRRRRGTA